MLMKQYIVPLLTLPMAALPLHAESPTPGRATVEWVSKTTGYSPGEPVVTAIKMRLEKGWHTYWSNPGEAGLPPTISMELPEGWQAGPLEFPLPIRFTTGDLHDFGYEGTVLFPIVLHPPADASGNVALTATFDWLACDDTACIPGNANVRLELNHGEGQSTTARPQIEETLKKIPAPAPQEYKLDLIEKTDTLKLTLTTPNSIDAHQLVVFPLTPNTAHPAADYQWSQDSGSWTAEVPKSPFAPDPIESFELVLHAPTLATPLTVTWKTTK